MTGLSELADDFAVELTGRLQRVVEGAPPFRGLARPPEGGDQGRVSISTYRPETSEQEAIRLETRAGDVLSLRVRYDFCWDRDASFLAVEYSEVRVNPAGRDDPLFRYEYDRAATGVPAAHVQVHGHRDELIHLMTRSGRSAQRGKGARVPRMSDVHFPVGGHRFRPCLEDVLEFVILELGVKAKSDYRAALREGRVLWRKIQLRSAIRDDPSEAASALRDLGYDVGHANNEPAGSRPRLEAI